MKPLSPTGFTVLRTLQEHPDMRVSTMRYGENVEWYATVGEPDRITFYDYRFPVPVFRRLLREGWIVEERHYERDSGTFQDGKMIHPPLIHTDYQLTDKGKEVK